MPSREGPNAVLRINGDLGRVAAVARVLNAIESSYNGLYTFEVIIDRRYPLPSFFDEFSRSRRLQSPRPSTALVERGDLLLLREANFTSPGFWRVIGALNPLETIRKFLNDEHRRSKDRRYRSRLEEERMEEEVARMRLDRVAEVTRQLRDIGVPEPIVRRIVVTLVVGPLRALEGAQNEGLITTAELESPSDPTGDEPDVPGPSR